ncbi:MAG: helicase-exonuclease AddAB subunit AddA [Clostridiaceae bacterium]|nr:helicase-exonuclease AddAB subunit AddA [Clostridiaceae bacterium]
MSGTKWTNEQWDAITTRDCNLLVAAAAGAGKTAVLVERIIKKITDENNPVDIDKLLVVTFTNAAAAEMRERIGEAISGLIDKGCDSKLIQRQLALLGRASITTIHSFCTDVIRSNFQSIDLDPGFRIADETESTLMKLEALNELFDEQYEKEDNKEFFELLECYGSNRGDESLMDMVLNIHTFIQSSPWPEKWLEDMTERFKLKDGTDFAHTLWGQVILDSVRLELEGIKEMLQKAMEIINSGSGLDKYMPVYQEDLLNIESLLRLIYSILPKDKENIPPHNRYTGKDISENNFLIEEKNGEPIWNKLYEALHGIEFSRLPACGKDADKAKQEKVKEIRDDVKSRVKKLCELINADSDEIVGDLKNLYPKIKCLKDLVLGMMEKYVAKKSRKKVVDFNDLEHLCLEILTCKDEDGNLVPSETAINYRKRFEEILVDEYQDSNLVQEIIINMISRADWGKPNVFMVGDVKQSIYRFRQARPELFLQKYLGYSEEKGSLYRKILLYKNFRSRKGVIDAVNFIFKQIMSVNAGELDYTDNEALNPGAEYAPCDTSKMVIGENAELHLIETGNGVTFDISSDGEGDTTPVEEEEIIDNIQCEARLVAQRIIQLMEPDKEGKYFAVFDKAKKEYRRLQFRDIVILLRTTKNWADVFADELAQFGIPAFADTGGGFFKTIEIQVILSLLQIIDNPLQDIPLLSVLRSPIASFTTDELGRIRLEDRKGPFYNALLKFAQGTDEASKKAARFLKKLEEWRNMSLYLSTDRLIWRLYDETGYYGMVGAMPEGEQRQANLRILFERARQYEETSYKGLFNFINFIDRLKSSRGDMGSAKILSESENVVRIISIHKSKGLEFPVVFVSGCGKKFNLQDLNKSILLHQDLGFGPDVVDSSLRFSYASAAKQAIKEKIRKETLSEEMRILYVALTRAREKLIITGATSDLTKTVARWISTADTGENRLPDFEMLKGNNYLDWIGPALSRHKDGKVLRDVISLDSGFKGLTEDSSQWQINLWSKKDILSQALIKEEDEDSFGGWLDSIAENEKQDPDITLEIERRLSWQYPYSKVSAIPAKVSVTELKRRFDLHYSEENNVLPGLPMLVKKPMFLEEKKGLSSAEKGTVLHFIMQHLNLSKIRDSYADFASLKSVVEAQIDTMVGKDLLTRQQAESVDIDKIIMFFVSDLGKRMLKSKAVNREVPFNMEIPCSEVLIGQDDVCEGEAVLLQGVIDCYFEEPDGIVLVDYKSDYVAPGGQDIIKKRYEYQINCYSRAIEQLTGKNVKERYIYLFWNGQVLEY